MNTGEYAINFDSTNNSKNIVAKLNNFDTAYSITGNRIVFRLVTKLLIVNYPEMSFRRIDLKACVPKQCVLLHSAVLSCVAACLVCVIVTGCDCQLDFNKDCYYYYLKADRICYETKWSKHDTVAHPLLYSA